MLLPELKIPVITISSTGVLQHLHHPFLPALPHFLTVVYHLSYCTRSKTFHISNNLFQVRFLVSANNHMHMAWHNNIAVDFKAFILLAKLYTVYNYLPVFVPYKSVYPFYNGKGYKVQMILVAKMIFSTHSGVGLTIKNRFFITNEKIILTEASGGLLTSFIKRYEL